MDELIDLHRLAGREFAGRVDGVGEDDWHRPSPCTAWSIRQLVDHVVRFNFFVPVLLAGGTIADAALPDDVLGSDPAGVAVQSVNEAQAAFEAPGALGSVVHHPAGDVPGVVFLVFRIYDFVLHGWDLADGLGLRFETAPGLLDFTLAKARELEAPMAASGMFSPPQPFGPGADPLTEILARTGRVSRDSTVGSPA
jgi:uncharacterized protein (TIGR03086 family)